MISKIIQKEKERQEVYLNGKAEMKDYAGWSCEVHKQNLINLKEYLEELRGPPEDIKELTKMIERYK